MVIDFEGLEPGDREEEILELFRRNFKAWPSFSITCSQSEYYRWKYIENLYGQGTCAIALDDNKIVGCNHAVRSKVMISNRSYVSCYGSDSLVDKDYRRQGIYRKMNLFNVDYKEKKGFEFHFTSTHLKGMTPSPKVVDMPFKVTNYMFIEDIELHAKHMDTSFLKRTGYSVMKLLKEKKRKQLNDISYDLVTNLEFNNPEFWMKIKDDYDFIIQRDIDFLNWRYIDCPDNGYCVIQAVEEGMLLGYIVCKIDTLNENYPTGSIVDLLTLPKRWDVCDTLIGSAVNFFKDKEINLVSTSVVQGHESARILNRYGFIDSRFGNYLTYIPYVSRIQNDFQQVKDPNKILFQYGDTDFI